MDGTFPSDGNDFLRLGRRNGVASAHRRVRFGHRCDAEGVLLVIWSESGGGRTLPMDGDGSGSWLREVALGMGLYRYRFYSVVGSRLVHESPHDRSEPRGLDRILRVVQ